MTVETRRTTAEELHQHTSFDEQTFWPPSSGCHPTTLSGGLLYLLERPPAAVS
jgi:hypothetical protein